MPTMLPASQEGAEDGRATCRGHSCGHHSLRNRVHNDCRDAEGVTMDGSVRQTMIRLRHEHGISLLRDLERLEAHLARLGTGQARRDPLPRLGGAPVVGGRRTTEQATQRRSDAPGALPAHAPLPPRMAAPLPLLNQALLAPGGRDRRDSGYYRPALRQPVICLPMLSMRTASSACFLMGRIFRSTQRHTSSLRTSKSSRKASRYSVLLWATMLSRLRSCPGRTRTHARSPWRTRRS